jgi:hypothetical protein
MFAIHLPSFGLSGGLSFHYPNRYGLDTLSLDVFSTFSISAISFT